ncbi:MAG: protein-L-isoaspartate O-methyltransferase [bacterium]
MRVADKLKEDGWLKTQNIINAFASIKRIDFLPSEAKGFAEIDEPLPIGYKQTNSQPLVVAFMLELLQPEPGQKILDIGCGSGWTTALLSYIVSQENNQGKVIGIEVIPELADFAANNLAKYDFIVNNVAEIICGNGVDGYNKEAPYDRILVSASAKQIHDQWKRELKTGGRIVASVGTSIWVLEKESEKDFRIEKHPGFLFVPLV